MSAEPEKKPLARAPHGAQRAAAFLLSLDESSAVALIQRLDARVVAEIASAMTTLDPSFADPGAVDEIYRELALHLHRPAGPRARDESELAALLERALGRERARGVLSQIEARRLRERPFAALEKEPAAALASVLVGESPAVAALVLAHSDPERSAAILSAFQPERALEVIRRMATLTPPGAEALASVSASLAGRVREAAKQPAPHPPKERLQSIAKLLNFTEQEIESAVLRGLDASDQPMAQAIREYMFTWTDLAAVEKREMQKILSSIETRVLAIALKASPPEVEANILENLSARVRAMVAEEREIAGALPMSEVRAARDEIVKTVRALMESGELKPPRAGEELVE